MHSRLPPAEGSTPSESLLPAAEAPSPEPCWPCSGTGRSRCPTASCLLSPFLRDHRKEGSSGKQSPLKSPACLRSPPGEGARRVFPPRQAALHSDPLLSPTQRLREPLRPLSPGPLPAAAMGTGRAGRAAGRPSGGDSGQWDVVPCSAVIGDRRGREDSAEGRAAYVGARGSSGREGLWRGFQAEGQAPRRAALVRAAVRAPAWDFRGREVAPRAPPATAQRWML